MITNQDSGTRIDEIADGIYRISTPVPPEAMPGNVNVSNLAGNESEVSIELDAVLVRIMSEGLPGGEPGQIISVLAPSGGSGSSTCGTRLGRPSGNGHDLVAAACRQIPHKSP